MTDLMHLANNIAQTPCFVCANAVERDGVEVCTVWVVGAYEVTYLTDDEGFHAGMLTDEMMDDLIIREV